MLVLSRKIGESIRIGSNVIITIHRLSKSRVSLTIEAPQDIKILRTEMILDPELQERIGCLPPFVEET